MAISDGASQEQKKLATTASKTLAQRMQMSGADLMQASSVVEASTTVGAGNDGARVEQLKGGSGA